MKVLAKLQNILYNNYSTETEAQQNCVCVNLLSLYSTFLIIIKHVRPDKGQLYPFLSGFQRALIYFSAALVLPFIILCHVLTYQAGKQYEQNVTTYKAQWS